MAVAAPPSPAPAGSPALLRAELMQLSRRLQWPVVLPRVMQALLWPVVLPRLMPALIWMFLRRLSVAGGAPEPDAGIVLACGPPEPDAGLDLDVVVATAAVAGGSPERRDSRGSICRFKFFSSSVRGIVWASLESI